MLWMPIMIWMSRWALIIHCWVLLGGMVLVTVTTTVNASSSAARCSGEGSATNYVGFWLTDNEHLIRTTMAAFWTWIKKAQWYQPWEGRLPSLPLLLSSQRNRASAPKLSYRRNGSDFKQVTRRYSWVLSRYLSVSFSRMKTWKEVTTLRWLKWRKGVELKMNTNKTLRSLLEFFNLPKCSEHRGRWIFYYIKGWYIYISLWSIESVNRSP